MRRGHGWMRRRRRRTLPGRRRWTRRGTTLVELLVALPILAVGLGAAAAFILSSSAHLGSGEARLQAAIHGIAVMDSLRLMDDDALPPPEAPWEGRRPVAHAEMLWRWDGCCHLEVELDGGHSAWGIRREGPSWALRPDGEAGP